MHHPEERIRRRFSLKPFGSLLIGSRSLIRSSVGLTLTCCYLMSVDLLASLRRAYPRRWAITYLCQLHPLIGVPSILSFSPSSQLIVSVSSSALGLAARRLVSHVSLGNMSFIHTLITTPHRSCQTYSKISPCLHLPRSLGDLRLGHGDPLNFLVDLRFWGCSPVWAGGGSHHDAGRPWSS